VIFTDIHLQNFRSYIDESFDLGPFVNIVVGPNATGKTNLMEALMLCSIGKSYRGNSLFIRSGQEWARIDVHTTSNQLRTVKIEDKQPTTKRFVIEDKEFTRMPQSQLHPVVLFDPSSLDLVYGEPQTRRNFLDNLLGQLDIDYQGILNKYKRVISQRNRLLKKDKTDAELFAWDIQLVELATQIVQSRVGLLEKINKSLESIYSIIAGKNIPLRAQYVSKTALDNYGANILKGLANNLALDKLRGFTGLGPHRDDVDFVFESKQHFSLASRGESRSLILALKIIEMQLLEDISGQKPLLLLDDVFSELDGLRRKTLTNYLKDHQTVITTTDADIVAKNFSASVHHIAVG